MAIELEIVARVFCDADRCNSVARLSVRLGTVDNDAFKDQALATFKALGWFSHLGRAWCPDHKWEYTSG